MRRTQSRYEWIHELRHVITDFMSQNLAFDNEYSHSARADIARKRGRLLLRIHQAYQRFSKHAQGNDSQAGKFDIIAGATTKSSTEKKSAEDPQSIVAALNASMCLSIANTIGRTCEHHYVLIIFVMTTKFLQIRNWQSIYQIH